VSTGGPAGFRRPAVAIATLPDGCGYPAAPPYYPSEGYPEYPFPNLASAPNEVYAALRRSLQLLGLDAANFGTRGWNPLGEIIQPGQKVVLKPNAVLHAHPEGLDPYSILTHPSVVRAMLDYVVIALQGKGEIAIADAPQVDCDFDAYIRLTGLDEVCRSFRQQAGLEVRLLDLRRLRGRRTGEIASARDLERRDGDPHDYRIVDLAGRSAFAGLNGCERIYGADYDRQEASRHHLGGRHEYCVSGTILHSDVFLSLPKLKTHGKVGVTLNLKGLVGINGDKNYVPHYRVGDPAAGGDEFPPSADPVRRRSRAAQRWMIDHLLARRQASLEPVYAGLTAGKRRIGGLLRRFGALPSEPGDGLGTGEWRGNDTAWRMTADLARILSYADAEGRICPSPQRKVFCLVDGVTAGEGDGPLHPRPRSARVLIAGAHPVLVDMACAQLMGFDPLEFPQFRHWTGEPDAALGVPGWRETLVAVGAQPAGVRLPDLPPLFPPFAYPHGWRPGFPEAPR
jgi:uncharacterized protein (DUF362 family)